MPLQVLEQGNGPRHGSFDNIVLVSDAPSFQSAALNAVVKRTGRKGKHMYAVLSSGMCVLFHFGMTGSLVFQGKPAPTYKNFSISVEEWPPKFTKIEFEFEGSVRMAFCDPRRLGRVRVMSEDTLFSLPPISALATDPLDFDLNLQAAYDAFQCTSSMVKPFLLKQDGVFSGIGNWIADEVLYQADIDPSFKANKLSSEQVVLLVSKIIEVNKVAAECMRNDEEYPSHWLFHNRWGKGNKKKSTMSDGSPIHFKTIGGRTTAIVGRKIIPITPIESVTEEVITNVAEEVVADGLMVAEQVVTEVVSVKKKNVSSSKKRKI